MAKITSYAALTGALTASGDLLVVVDISDTTMAASGTDKNITIAELLIGLGALPLAGGTMTGGITSTLGTITTNKPALSATQTWNDAAVAFKGISIDVTATAAGGASNIFEVRRNGTLSLNVDQYGATTTVAHTVTSLTDANGKFSLSGNSSGLALGSARFIKWASVDAYNGTADVGLYRNAAGVIEVNNGTAGTFRDLKLRNATATGAFSNAPTTGSEIFGAGVLVGTGINHTVVGNLGSTVGASAPGCIAIGKGATISGDSGGAGSIVIGTGSTFSNSNGTLIGNGLTSAAASVVLIGQGNSATQGTLAMGTANALTNFGAMALGTGNTNAQLSSFVFGHSISSTRRNEVVFGSASVSGSGFYTGGRRIRIQDEASDAAAYSMAIYDSTWIDATVATRKSRLAFSVYNVAAVQEGLRIDAGATLPTVSLVPGANAQSLNVKVLTELTTIAAAATTDTTVQMPAGAIVLAVSVRVTTVIPTAATFTVGDSGLATRFSTAAVSTAATSTDAGTKAGAYYNAGALAVRITPDLTPAAATGVVRVTVHYIDITPPTS